MSDNKYLDIDTTGWLEIACDKCGSVTCFDPTFPPESQVCMACSPMRLPEEELKGVTE